MQNRLFKASCKTQNRRMKVKEKLKKRLDALPDKDMKTVSVLLDQIERKNRVGKGFEKTVFEQPYEKVANLLEKSPLTTKEIQDLRADRL